MGDAVEQAAQFYGTAMNVTNGEHRFAREVEWRRLPVGNLDGDRNGHIHSGNSRP
jgi:hypothetical protein